MANGSITMNYGTKLWSESITQISDFNNVPYDGYLRISLFVFDYTALNSPASTASGGGFMVVTNSQYAIQVAVANYQNKVYIRYLAEGNWSSWRTI